jgi:preprotein translocase SecE subunit
MFTQIYKPGQGKYTRLGSGFTVAVTVAVGCWRLYELLTASDLSLWTTTMVPAVILVAFSAATYWLLNKPAVADFLIAAEGELKKVNWSSRKEIAVSTFVVIIVVLTMSALLGATDFVFQLVFQTLIG